MSNDENNNPIKDNLQKDMISEDDEWISEEETFFRLKLDNLKHIKNTFNSIIKLKSKKIKRLDKQQRNEVKKYDSFLSQDYFPFLELSGIPNDENNKEIVNLTINDNKYDVESKPEVGTNLFFKIEENNLKYIGKSEEYLNAVKKRVKYKPSKKVSKKKFPSVRRTASLGFQNSLDEKDIDNIKGSIDERFKVGDLIRNEKKSEGIKKKRRRKRRYLKNGTIKIIQKIEKKENNNNN